MFGVAGLNALEFAAAETAARALALEAENMEVRVPDDFERALEVARTKHTEAGVLLSSPLVWLASKQIGELAIAKRLHFTVRQIFHGQRLDRLWAERSRLVPKMRGLRR